MALEAQLQRSLLTQQQQQLQLQPQSCQSLASSAL
jgi:hypothetical protein